MSLLIDHSQNLPARMRLRIDGMTGGLMRIEVRENLAGVELVGSTTYYQRPILNVLFWQSNQ